MAERPVPRPANQRPRAGLEDARHWRRGRGGEPRWPDTSDGPSRSQTQKRKGLRIHPALCFLRRRIPFFEARRRAEPGQTGNPAESRRKEPDRAGTEVGPCPRLLWLRPAPTLLAYSAPTTAASPFLQKPRRRGPDGWDPRAAAALKATVTVASWGASALPGAVYLEAWPAQPHEARPLPPVTVVSSALITPIVSTLPIVSHAAARASAGAEREGAGEPDGAAGAPSGAAPRDEHAYHRARLEPEAGLDGVVAALQRKVRGLQQRQRRHRARLGALEGLVQQLRRDHLLSHERLRLLGATCLPGGPTRPDPAGAGAVAIVCGEQPAAVLYTLTPAHDP
ncbi:THAP domain-containing protein 8 [Vombatus ursinus]|uniref:THAP domain-containing protein 8 n=1 Tax=Vombatus ursinus TaxID=29139 RepID=UPI000FFD14D6|nr:THAP domain-containing protein 8 [Vombatus ursinus]